MNVILLNSNGYIASAFEGVNFPIKVKAKLITRGIERGFVAVTIGELMKHGFKCSPCFEGFEHDYDHAFTFAPDEFKRV